MTPKVLPEALIEELRAWPKHASPRPWTYHNRPDFGTMGRDWIEDANSNIVVENVGHIDGPAICTAVNALASPPSRVLQDEGVVAFQEAVAVSLDGLPPVQVENLHYFANSAPAPYDSPAVKAMARELLAYRKICSEPLYAAPPAILPSTIGGSVGVSEALPSREWMRDKIATDPEEGAIGALSPAISGEPTGDETDDNEIDWCDLDGPGMRSL